MLTAIRFVAVSGLLLGICSSLLAQQREPAPANPRLKNPPAATAAPGAAPATPIQARDRAVPRTANKPVLPEIMPAQVDQMIASMLALCNEEEAEVGTFAAKHAQHDDVKKFAEQMAKQHGDMAKQLQKWAPEATLGHGHEGNTEKSTASAAGGPMPFDPLRVHQQIASRSLASAEKFLGGKKGTDFDMAYVGSQCVLHQQMIDKASVLRQYASPDLRSTIDKGIDAAEQHLDQTKSLIEKLSAAEKKAK
jgi:predicted outer membrane protein